MVFTGDIQQIDHPYLDSLSNGLSYLVSRMVGQTIYAHITLEKGERSALADLASDCCRPRTHQLRVMPFITAERDAYAGSTVAR